MNKEKLQKILEGISNSGLEGSFKMVEEEMKKITTKLREESEIKTVELAKKKIKEIKDQIQLLLDAFEKLKNDFTESEKKLSKFLNEKLGLLKNALDKVNSTSSERSQVLSDEISSLKSEIAEVSGRKIKIPDFNKQIQDMEVGLRRAISELKENDSSKGFQSKFEDLEKDIKKLRSDAMSALANRGGSAHLQVNVNSSVASTRYADINFQQSGNIGWSAVNDDTLKRVNIRASILVGGGGSGTPGGSDTQVQFNDNGSFGGDPALTWASSVLAVGQPGSVSGRIDLAGATAQTVRVQVPSTAGAWTLTLPANDGGAGQYLLTDGNGITQWASVTGGSGITRIVSVLSVSSTLAAAATTDYVYFANVGINLTLPTAISNLNLYSLKNNSGTSSVLVSTTAGQTIDGSATALMPTDNESLTFLSNGSIWGVL